MEKPSINLGNNDWATKESKLLGYNIDDQNYYDPIEFDVTRASTKTSVGRDGLIKTNANNIASIDFNGDVKGKLNLEPQSTNLITHSENFSDSSWLKINSTVTLTSDVAPDGTSNSVYNYVGNNSNCFTYSQASGIEYTISFYVKSNNASKDNFRLRLGTTYGSNLEATSEWVRHSFTTTAATSVFSISSIGATDTDILIWGAQLEALSYPTSYIKTITGQVTRVGDLVNGAGSVDNFNSSEGVLYAEIQALDSVAGTRSIAINNNSNANRIQLYFNSIGNLTFLVSVSSATQAQISFTTDITVSHKVACKWKLNDFALWVDGVEIGTDNTGSVPSTNVLISLHLAGLSGTSNPFYGNLKDLKVYKTALTDSELTALTS